jgi:hypothetical protein
MAGAYPAGATFSMPFLRLHRCLERMSQNMLALTLREQLAGNALQKFTLMFSFLGAFALLNLMTACYPCRNSIPNFHNICFSGGICTDSSISICRDLAATRAAYVFEAVYITYNAHAVVGMP